MFYRPGKVLFVPASVFACHFPCLCPKVVLQPLAVKPFLPPRHAAPHYRKLLDQENLWTRAALCVERFSDLPQRKVLYYFFSSLCFQRLLIIQVLPLFLSCRGVFNHCSPPSSKTYLMPSSSSRKRLISVVLCVNVRRVLRVEALQMLMLQ